MDADRRLLEELFAEAVAAVDPFDAVRRAVEVEDGHLVAPIRFALSGPGRVVVIAVGKAAARMYAGLSSGLGERLREGLVVTDGPAPGGVRTIRSTHPVPGAESVRAGRDALRLVSSARPEDLVVVLLSGGGSALLEVPARGLTIDDLAATTEALLVSGAPIGVMNAVRKHLSAIKGGLLAAAAGKTTVLTMALSDVVGDQLDVIASGPTVPDPTTFRDALAGLEEFGLTEQVPGAVVDHLRAGSGGTMSETPKRTGVARHTLVVGRGADAAGAAVAGGRKRGVASSVVTTSLSGDAEVRAREAVAETGRAGLEVFAGETTVEVKGGGRGGRNQHAALAAAIVIAERTTMLAAGTDGVDGPTSAAGAIVDGGTVSRGTARGLDVAEHLAAHDSNTFLDAAGDLLVTGPTGTNVGDLWLVLRRP